MITDVETELRKMQKALADAGVTNGAKVCEIAADIVKESGKAVDELDRHHELAARARKRLHDGNLKGCDAILRELAGIPEA